MDVDKSGTLSVQEFLAIPELEHNPLVNRVVHTFDIDKSGEVDFREFVSSLSVFATHESSASGKEQKYKFTFRVYDVDNDGFISNADLYHVLKAMVGSNLNDIQLQQLVDRTIIQGDKDKDGKLNYEEFKEMIKDGVQQTHSTQSRERSRERETGNNATGIGTGTGEERKRCGGDGCR